ncbi:hypothetical protein B0H14DRAFT_2582603 [Mycena olivaceomarginata]|nr:hypothetical protein B0H14DRAFT_2582603 [Mycena olivaceomarginata]
MAAAAKASDPTRTGDENASGLFDNVYSLSLKSPALQMAVIATNLTACWQVSEVFNPSTSAEARSESQAPEAEVALCGVTALKDRQGRESTRAELELDHNTPTMTSVFAMWTIDLTIRSSASTPAVGGSIVRPDSGEERHVQVESVYKWVSFEKVWATGEAHHEADAPGALGLTPISLKKTWMGREGEGKCSSVSSTESAMIRNSGPSCVD